MKENEREDDIWIIVFANEAGQKSSSRDFAKRNLSSDKAGSRIDEVLEGKRLSG